MIPDETRVIDLTLGELAAALSERLGIGAAAPAPPPPPTEKRHYEYGPKGFAKIFGCSVSTFYEWKRRGIIDQLEPAICQIGKRMVIDVEKALELGKNITKQNQGK